jgi:transcription initiation factor TFIID subunit 11
MSILTDDQLARYESFRRSKLTEPLRRLVQIVTGTKPDVHNRLLIALSSVTKSFVGELIEEARRIADEEGHGGPLQPQHVHVAYAKLKAENRVECAAPVKNRFRL